jgi:hypothetical protein
MTGRMLMVTLDCSANVGIHINHGALMGLADMLGGITNPSSIFVPVFILPLAAPLLEEELVIRS